MIRRDFRCPGPSPMASLPPPRPAEVRGDRRHRTGALHPLLDEIEVFQRARAVARRPVSDCQFGLRCKGDPNLVLRMREGTWPRAETVAKVRAWICEQGVLA